MKPLYIKKIDILGYYYFIVTNGNQAVGTDKERKSYYLCNFPSNFLFTYHEFAAKDLLKICEKMELRVNDEL